jgi:hypothetical protein
VINDRSFLRSLTGKLRVAGHDVRVFGGWAEELREMRGKGPHSDIDLLLLAEDFETLESFMNGLPNAKPIAGKSFPHKRAWEVDGVRVEFLLVAPGEVNATVMFHGEPVILWPPGTFSGPPVDGMPVAGSEALQTYRALREAIEAARETYLEAVRRGLTRKALTGEPSPPSILRGRQTRV